MLNSTVNPFSVGTTRVRSVRSPSSLTMTAVHFPSFLETVSRAFLESNSSIVAVVVQTPEKSATFGESAAFIHGVAMQSPSASVSTLCFMVNLTNGFKRTSPVKTDKFSTIGPYKNVIS